ncbi:hypothetical protein QYF36_011163 [Acer negundo]|nr:hypothetical protein QYF36_011163 [Acer negundo]
MEQFVQKVEIESDIFNRTMVCDSPILPIYTDKEYESSTNHGKSRSKVWDVFQKISAEHDEDSKAICRYCKKVYSAKPANGTSHLRRHLESCLKRDHHERKRDNHELQHDYHGIKHYKVSHESLTDVTLSPRNYKNDLNEISSAIAMMIVTDKQAFRMVEDMGFKSVMAVACPEFEMMSKGAVKRDIISIYMKEREKVRPENFMTGMLVEMQVKFSKYWSENNLILSCAAIMDPRYKVKFIEYCYTKLYGFDAQQHVGKIVRTLFSLFDEYIKSSACSSRITGTSVNVSNDKEDNDEFEDYKTFRSSIFRAEEEKLLTRHGIQAIWKTKWKTKTPVPVMMLMIIRCWWLDRMSNLVW